MPSLENLSADRLMDLESYRPDQLGRGAPWPVEIIWLLLSALLVESWLPGSRWRVVLLRAFGAKIGNGTIIKPRVRIKFPWKLSIGDHVWIGEDVWIDNLAQVSLGSHVCLSQGVYLCTGSHDWSLIGFDLIVRPITISDECWVGAMARLAPGTTMGKGAVVGLGAVVSGHVGAGDIAYVDQSNTLALKRRHRRAEQRLET